MFVSYYSHNRQIIQLLLVYSACGLRTRYVGQVTDDALDRPTADCSQHAAVNVDIFSFSALNYLVNFVFY